MTPENLNLNPSGFNERPLFLYRIARTKYANLSGVGAALAPGRWNVAGEPALYTSLHQSTCILERLVHTPKDLLPKDLALMVISLDTSDIEDPSGKLYENTAIYNIRHPFGCYTSLQQANAAFSERHRPGKLMYETDPAPLAIGLPSVIIPEWNVVLYPNHPKYWEMVKLISIEPFEYDPRLFPENVPADQTISP